MLDAEREIYRSALAKRIYPLSAQQLMKMAYIRSQILTM